MRVGTDLVRKYRLSGECDDCATEAAALATGFDPIGHGVSEPCINPGCRFYDAEYAAAVASLTADPAPDADGLLGPVGASQFPAQSGSE